MDQEKFTDVVVFSETGGPEVLRVVRKRLPRPAMGEVLVRHTLVGVDFVDVYHRRGLYPTELPSGLGYEAVGVIEDVGPGVQGLEPGTRVGYPQGPLGAYAGARVLLAMNVVRIPDDVPDEVIAGGFLKGLTALALLGHTRPLARGETALFHAAAGGVGHLAGQIAQARGLRLIGVARGPDKCAFALTQGYDACIDSEREDVVRRLHELNGGRGVPVVYDSVGRATWTISLDCLLPFGMLVSFGNASGPPPPLVLGELARRGSLYVTRPTLATFWADEQRRRILLDEFFALARSGSLRPVIGGRYPLSEVARAHRDLESRRTRGALLLVP